MSRLKKVASRKMETFKFEEAKDLAIEYAKEDGMHYAVIQAPGASQPYEIIPDDFDHPSEIPGILYHTEADIKDIEDYNPHNPKNIRPRYED